MGVTHAHQVAVPDLHLPQQQLVEVRLRQVFVTMLNEVDPELGKVAMLAGQGTGPDALRASRK